MSIEKVMPILSEDAARRFAELTARLAVNRAVTMVVTADDGQGNWSAQDTQSAVLDRLREGPQSALALRKAFGICAGAAARRFAGELAKMQREGLIAFDHASRTWGKQ